MTRESKLTLSDFVNKDRFELNSYLTYLFHQYNDDNQDHPIDKKIKQ